MKPEEHIIYKIMDEVPNAKYLVFRDFIRYNGTPQSFFYNYNYTEVLDTDPRILDHSYEPVIFTLDKNMWEGVWLKSKIPNAVILVSEKNSKDLDIINKIGYKTCNWFSHGQLCSEYWYRLYKNIKIVTSRKKLEHKWLCANRLIEIPRDYRIKFLNKLDTKTGIYSLLERDPNTNRTPNEIYKLNKIKPNSFDLHDNSSSHLSLRANDDKPTIKHQFLFNEWITSFLHVVTETVVDRTHLTEKIFKPVVLHQPFVLVGGSGCLKYMREYGFETFSQWWDESYDNIEDLDLRMQAVADIVNRIGNMSLDDLEDMRNEMWPILEHNYNWFYNGFSDRVWKELVLNLKSVI